MANQSKPRLAYALGTRMFSPPLGANSKRGTGRGHKNRPHRLWPFPYDIGAKHLLAAVLVGLLDSGSAVADASPPPRAP